MSWYDWFSNIYDASLETLYADAREAAAQRLDLAHAHSVLDVPTGTGQSLPQLVRGLPPRGEVVAADLSAGMLRRASRRVAAGGFEERVRFVQADAAEFTLDAPVDRLHVFLGLTAMPNYEQVFERLWQLLVPGGRAVVVDVYAERLGMQGRMVNLVARADIQRKTWEPLESLAADFTREELPPNSKYGGTLWLATGTKAG